MSVMMRMEGVPVVRRLSKSAEHLLGHLRYGCAGKRCLASIHHHVDNQPQLHMPAFFSCPTCFITTDEQHFPQTEKPPATPEHDWFDGPLEDKDSQLTPGQCFHIDFGFMKGTGYCTKDEEGRTITSIDGFRSYFLIIDRRTRYTWVFLTKTKKPPIQIFKQFLKEHGHPSAHHKTIRCDKGGELQGSQAFKEVIAEANYIMEPTAPNAPFQNGLAERPNRTLAKMVTRLLRNAGLGPEFWSFALLHAVYLKNRLPHRATNQVPLTQYTGKRPNARRLRIFGCPVVVRNLGRKPAKLDTHTTAGIFLGYTATEKNITYMDSVTKRFKTATHVVFDEAGMTLPASELTPAAKMLQQLGYEKSDKEEDSEELSQLADNDQHQQMPPSTAAVVNDKEDHHDNTTLDTRDQGQPIPINAIEFTMHGNLESNTFQDAVNCRDAPNEIKIVCLSPTAKIPLRATDGSAGYDLFSAREITIPPQTRVCIPLDIQMQPPVGVYGQIFSRSGLALKHYIDVCAGTIDRDYTCNIQVLLCNNGQNAFNIKVGDRIAQMVFLRYQTPDIGQTTTLPDTTRGDQGFGSTGITNEGATIHNLNGAHPKQQTPTVPTSTERTDIERPIDLFFSNNPFDSTLEIEIPIKGDHPTLGLLTTYCEYRQRLQVKDMALSTPGSRLKCWRTVIRNGYILKFNEFAITSQADLEHAVSQVRRRGLMKAKFVLATDKSYGVHPLEGIMQIHFDQLNVIAKHLEDIHREHQQSKIASTVGQMSEAPTTQLAPPEQPTPAPVPPKPPPLIADADLAQQFSMKQAMKHADWPEFKKGIYKQLDQYWNQGMFSHPMPLPRNANALQMLWRFNIKACGTRKSRMVCNGSPRQKGTVTLGHTYANALDAASERLFWALVASEGLIEIGADVSNAFADAPAPKASLFLYIDDSFRDWWTNHLGKEPIPADCKVVRVNNAIQGHPESPRLWEKHIDGILRDLGLTPATHEPCLYSGNINRTRVQDENRSETPGFN